MGESPGAMEARAPVGARPESAMRRPGGASTGGMDSERAVVSGRASAALRIVPRALRDPLYRLVARNRYRLFGQRETCWVPSAADRRRVL